MNIKWYFSIIVVYLNFVHCELELKLTKGTIRGKILKSRDGRSYYSYTGIPYAKPPIGKLRFQAPKPVEPWSETLDATKESNICSQQGLIGGSEDCLYLNVYSPSTQNKSLPVMFWVHGGGFTWGHGRSDSFGPDYFMDKDVILVTINYRLGILGFLSTEDDVIPGNFGMKDQVEALRWVKENIIKFNGDPNQVTLFGGSAGAASIGFHMLSPMSKGLFYKAILQSGAPVCKWAILPFGIPSKRAHSIATIAGCNFDNSEGILKCLRKLPVQYLMDLHTKLYSWLTQPFILFNPVVENCNDSSQEAFLCHHPIYDFKQESFVPAIVGMNSAEGGLYAASMYNKTSLIYPDLRTYFNRQISIMVGYNYYTKSEYIDKIGKTLLKKYFPSGEIVDNTHLEMVKVFTDGSFTQCILDMAYQLSSPIYSYIYDYHNEFSFNVKYGSCETPLGVTHGDELYSFFKMNGLKQNNLNERDLNVSKLMINIWYKFVSSDKPTIDGSENGLVWPEFTRSNQLIMYLNSSQPSIKQNPSTDIYEFWNSLPIYPK